MKDFIKEYLITIVVSAVAAIFTTIIVGSISP